MVHKTDAVYEHGILRPLGLLPLTESQRVTLTIADASHGGSKLDIDLIERARAEVNAMDSIPTIEEVRTALSSITGSLSNDVIAERGDY